MLIGHKELTGKLINLLHFCRNICSRNYHTVTELAYQPYKENSGKEPLPSNVHQVGSGFVRQKPVTIPKEVDVSKAWFMVSIINWTIDETSGSLSTFTCKVFFTKHYLLRVNLILKSSLANIL